MRRRPFLLIDETDSRLGRRLRLLYLAPITIILWPITIVCSGLYHEGFGAFREIYKAWTQERWP